MLGSSSSSAPTHAPRAPSAASRQLRQSSLQPHMMLPHLWLSDEIHDWASLPFHMGGCGLRSATRTRVPAHWASWADSLRMIHNRHPEVAATMVRCLSGPTDMPHFAAVASCRVELRTLGCNIPEWEDLPLLFLVHWLRGFQVCWPFQRRGGNMTLLWLWSSTSWKLRSSLPPLQLDGPCSGRKEVLSLASRSLLPITPSTGSSLTCSGSSFFVAFTFLSHCPPASAGVAVHSTALATTAQVAPGQGSLGGVASHWSLQWRAFWREAGASVSVNVFLRDLDLPVGAMDQRRIEVIAEGLPVFHRAQLAIDATFVSPLRADGEPHRRRPVEDGVALTLARWCKERTYPELTGSGRAKLVVIAGETGGRFSEETQTFLRLLAQAKTRSVPKVLRVRARQSWLHRWGSILSCAAARAFAYSLLGLHGNLGAEGDVPVFVRRGRRACCVGCAQRLLQGSHR